MFYAKSTGGFYDEAFHGARKIKAEDGETDIDNPDCKIPADAVEITAEAHAELLAAQSSGKIIKADADGNPVAVNPPALKGNDLILSQIAALEETVTPRRQREAILGTDSGWLADVNTQIAALRAKLK